MPCAGVTGHIMRIAKPLLMITTPIGLALGLYEGYRLAGGLVFLMAAMMGVIGVAMASVVRTVRREREAERRKAAEASSNPPSRQD
jgi:hypothetical protein